MKRVPALAEKTAPAALHSACARRIAAGHLLREPPRRRQDGEIRDAHDGLPRGGPGPPLAGLDAQELKGLPIFRTVIPFTAYGEGWALYAEQLAWEAGYEKAPLDDLGRLQAELFRSVRLVVDTGLHAKRWTREQAIDYMKSTTGMPEGDVVIEIERYLVQPGQALAYKIGMLKILELRDRARSALGSRFDLREFHDVVLRNGAMPLAILERVVDDYVTRKKIAQN